MSETKKMYWNIPNIQVMSVKNVYNTYDKFISKVYDKDYNDLKEICPIKFEKLSNPDYFGQILTLINFLGLLQTRKENDTYFIKQNVFLESNMNKPGFIARYLDYSLAYFQYPRFNQNENINMAIRKPYLLILELLVELEKLNKREAYLTRTEFYKLFKVSNSINKSYDDITTDLAIELIEQRENNNIEVVKVRVLAYDTTYLRNSSLLTFENSDYNNNEDFAFGLSKEYGVIDKIKWLLSDEIKNDICEIDEELSDKDNATKWAEFLNNQVRFDTWKENVLDDNLPVNMYININEPHNKIVYGAPGTGKSHLLKERTNEFFNPINVDRVTFYNGYTYGQFVGTFKPKPIYRDIASNTIQHNLLTTVTDHHEPIITYEFIAGPFIELLIKALQNSSSIYCLIIEEINRTKVDAVFGNIFQLLDRSENGDSKYSINPSSELLLYLKNNLDSSIYLEIETNGLKIPNNFYLWATMNSADQGVFPMDTAFKRRWDFEYISLNENETYMDGLDINIGDNNYVEYNTFRKVVNKLLVSDYNIVEDRLIAPFFLKRNDFKIITERDNLVLDEKVFKNKIIMYLKDDILRHNKNEKVFAFDTFSEIIENYPTSKIINNSITFP